MTIIAALPMPNPLPVNAVTFNLTPVQMLTPTNTGGGGFIQSIDRTTPMWTAKYVTRPLASTSGSAYQNWIRWLDLLEGSNYPFQAFHPRFPVPQVFMSQMPGALTSHPWGAAPVVSANNFSDPGYIINGVQQGTLTLSGLTVGTVLSPGDFISYQNGNLLLLYRVTDWAGPGAISKVAVKPRPQDVISTSLAVNLSKPCCAMKLTGVPSWTDDVSSFPICTITAAQYMERGT